MIYTIVKSIHIIGVICLFAGLFYLVRLYIYDKIDDENPRPESKVIQAQFRLMQKRLWYGITVPSAWVTFLSGGYLISIVQAHKQPWFHLKALFLLGLFLYHFYCGYYRKKLLQNQCLRSSRYFRFYNEIATILMILIVFLAMTKSFIGLAYGFIAFFMLGLFIMVFLKKKLQGGK